MVSSKTLRTCKYGHNYYKSSDCPVCPVCAKEKNSGTGFLSELGAPAKRALEGKGIKTLKQLSKYSEKELLQWHGLGPSSLPKLKAALKKAGLKLKE